MPLAEYIQHHMVVLGGRRVYIVIHGKDRDAVSIRRIFGNTHPDGNTFRYTEDDFQLKVNRYSCKTS